MLDDAVVNYWFHHRPSFPGGDPGLYKDLVSNADSCIDVWDPYFNIGIGKQDHLVFDSTKTNVAIRILTTKGLFGPNVNYPSDIHSLFKSTIPASKNISLGVGVIDKQTKRDWAFHDRFLIIDNKTVFIVGASIEYNYKSISSTGIYKVSDINTSNFIIDQFLNHWNETTKYPTNGVQLLHI